MLRFIEWSDRMITDHLSLNIPVQSQIIDNTVGDLKVNDVTVNNECSTGTGRA